MLDRVDPYTYKGLRGDDKGLMALRVPPPPNPFRLKEEGVVYGRTLDRSIFCSEYAMGQ